MYLPDLLLSLQAGWQISQQPTSPTQTRRRRRGKKKTREMTTQSLHIKMLATAAATPTTCFWDSLLWVCMDKRTWATSLWQIPATFSTKSVELDLWSDLLFESSICAASTICALKARCTDSTHAFPWDFLSLLLTFICLCKHFDMFLCHCHLCPAESNVSQEVKKSVIFVCNLSPSF